MIVTIRLRKLSLALLPAMAFFAVTAMPGSVLGQEERIRGRSPGFRTDFGVYLIGGGNSCAGGGCEADAISAPKWSTHLGIAAGIVVRPYRFFSVGLDVSFTNLVPAEETKALKRFFDLAISPVLRLHIPVRFRTVVLEPAMGVGIGFVNGYLQYDGIDSASRKTSRRYFGPVISGIIGLNLFLTPKMSIIS